MSAFNYFNTATCPERCRRTRAFSVCASVLGWQTRRAKVTFGTERKRLIQSQQVIERMVARGGIEPPTASLFLAGINHQLTRSLEPQSQRHSRGLNVSWGPQAGRGCQQTRPVNWRKRRIPRRNGPSEVQHRSSPTAHAIGRTVARNRTSAECLG